MYKDRFNKIFDILYDLTDGKPQVGNCPDVVVDFSTISWTLKIEIYVNGFTVGDKPDYCYYLDDESSDEYVCRAIDTLNTCLLFKNIFSKNWHDEAISTMAKKLVKLSENG